MASEEDVEGFRASTAALVILAQQHLAEFFGGVDLSSPAAPQLITDFYVPFTQEYGRAAASLGADYFDTLRSQSSARGAFEAIVADPISSDHVANIVKKETAIPLKEQQSASPTHTPTTREPAQAASRVTEQSRATVTDSGAAQSSAEPRSRVTVTDTGSGTTRSGGSNVQVTDAGKNPARSPRSRVTVNDASPKRLNDEAQRLIMRPARETIVRSVAKDPAKAKWARIPSGPTTCAFCLVMASRGAVYRTEKTAGGGDEMNRYHLLCDCTATPFWRGDPYPESYNPDALYALYTKARKASGSANLTVGEGSTSILSTLRKQQGIR
ncbi:hypothetical protein [Rhodococcus opacus]|uniref:Capsid maturation protease n=1 Tax=Rhodococcus opacus TaxID=37919 RepID=A0A2S8JAS8_RHOOP|nr:hypothetical protein [Rhodococcus opacus]PQP24156.1 hypothetical protein C5613_14850 [Rhodococcus opacus]